jgi:methionyl-tRNA formyltransferase
MKLQSSAVKQFALEKGLPVAQPHSLKLDGKYPEEAAAAQAFIAQAQADVMVVAAYGLILPQWALDAPRFGCLNIHASLLPRWRGAAPIHRAILAGDAETGICIMQMDEGLDTGAVLQRQATPIRAEETTADLHDRLSTMGADLILQALDRLPDLPLQPQSAEGVTYAAKIDKAEARIDWTLPAEQVDRQIRGLSPFPGAWTMVGDERLKLLRSRLAQGAGAAGQVLHGMTIACGSGAVEITEAQREGKRPTSATDLLRGFALPALLS